MLGECSPGIRQLLFLLILFTSLVAQMVKCLPTMRETWVQYPGQEDLLEKEMQPTPVFLPGKSLERRSLVDYSPWGCNESDMIEQLFLLIWKY